MFLSFGVTTNLLNFPFGKRLMYTQVIALNVKGSLSSAVAVAFILGVLPLASVCARTVTRAAPFTPHNSHVA